jgi:uncharacterized protein (TIGR02284 family)
VAAHSLENLVIQNREYVVQVLNGLIETTLDSAVGYEKAAELARNPRFKNLFQERAHARRQLAQEIDAEIRTAGGEPPTGGSILGQAHRVFAELRDRIAGQSDKALAEEVERGESFVCARFQAATQDDALPAEARQLIARAHGAISADHDAARALKDEFQ